ncbi:hypothetical protein [Martelella radicis]|uniref:Glycosyl hydrolase family 32 N-terminal domain-containing protein n=1 Tax=Martelella radicis TaxID=1397476 RepID=A0A7W6KMR5_9HYPH|nr:hypothetical protein [Martelella radicis]MBB4124184.1 hypothetical protein [Martelella radicis]
MLIPALMIALLGVSPVAAGPLSFELVETAKVIDAGRPGQPTFLADPGVFADESGYHLFVTNHFCDRAGDGVFNDNDYQFDAEGMFAACLDPDGPRHNHGAAILYANSGDGGRTWAIRPEPVLAPEPGAYDSDKTETAFPIVIGDALYLFYSATGQNADIGFVPARYAIGGARLDLAGRTIGQALLRDREVFEKLGDAPVLDFITDQRAYGNNVQEPSVVLREDGGIELFFTALRLTNPRDIGDGLDGIALMRATFADESLADPQIEMSNALDLSDLPWSLDMSATRLPLNIQEIYYRNGGYHAFYTSLGDDDFHQNQDIRYAYSEDGLTWEDEKTLITRDRTFSQWGVMAPSAVFADGYVDIFYTAFGEVADHPCIARGDDARMGTGIKQGRACLYAMVGRSRFAIRE